MSAIGVLILIIVGLFIQVGIIATGVSWGTQGIRRDLAELKGQAPVVPN